MTLVARGQNLVVHKEKRRYAPRNDKSLQDRARPGAVPLAVQFADRLVVAVMPLWFDADGCGAGGEGGRETSVDWGNWRWWRRSEPWSSSEN